MFVLFPMLEVRNFPVASLYDERMSPLSSQGVLSVSRCLGPLATAFLLPRPPPLLYFFANDVFYGRSGPFLSPFDKVDPFRDFLFSC